MQPGDIITVTSSFSKRPLALGLVLRTNSVVLPDVSGHEPVDVLKVWFWESGSIVSRTKDFWENDYRVLFHV